MRISLISLGQTGAGPVYSLEMAKALASNSKCELQVIISTKVTNNDAWNDAFLNTNVDFHVIEAYNHNKRSVILSCFNIAKQERLVRLIKGFNPDILYIPFGFMWARYVYYRLYKHVKIISTLHDVEFHDSWYNLSIAELGSYLLTCGSRRFIDGYVILNNKDVPTVKEKTGKDVCVIPHASFGYYFKEKSQQQKSIKNCIGFFGRIEIYKGLDLLIEAFEQTTTDDLKLLIAGSGKIEEPLLRRIKSNPNIKLINRYIEDTEFDGLLEEVDIVVLPYKRASQSGVIPLCFAAGKTVIATNVGALNEQIPQGTGILTEVGALKISKAIDDLYKNEKEIYELGKNAKKYAETELSWSKSAELLINFAEEIILMNKKTES